MKIYTKKNLLRSFYFKNTLPINQFTFGIEIFFFSISNLQKFRKFIRSNIYYICTKNIIMPKFKWCNKIIAVNEQFLLFTIESSDKVK